MEKNLWNVKRNLDKLICSMAEGPDGWNVALDAYNRFIEDECSGNGYVFDLDKQDDLKCLVDGGMTRQDILELNENKYVTIDHQSSGKNLDYKALSKEEVSNYIEFYSEEVADAILSCPHVAEYTRIWQIFYHKESEKEE